MQWMCCHCKCASRGDMHSPPALCGADSRDGNDGRLPYAGRIRSFPMMAVMAGLLPFSPILIRKDRFASLLPLCSPSLVPHAPARSRGRALRAGGAAGRGRAGGAAAAAASAVAGAAGAGGGRDAAPTHRDPYLYLSTLTSTGPRAARGPREESEL